MAGETQALEVGKHYSDTVRTEIVWRIGHRDQWLKIQLLAQLGVFALVNGLDLGVVGADKVVAGAPAFAFPTALLLACFYVVEDRLIGLASAYLGALAKEMPTVGEKYLLPWDASPQLRQYAIEGTLIVRLVGQVLAFLVLPATVVIFSANSDTKLDGGAVWVSAGCGGLVTVLLGWSVYHRWRTGTHDSDPVAVAVWPAPMAVVDRQWLRVAFIIVLLAGFLSVVAGLWALGNPTPSTGLHPTATGR